jgi:uncharacterized membrane protein YkgB
MTNQKIKRIIITIISLAFVALLPQLWKSPDVQVAYGYLKNTGIPFLISTFQDIALIIKNL